MNPLNNHPNNQRKPTLLIIAGGTGGHIFPGLAVAQHMQARGWRIVWVGHPAGMEAILVPKQAIPIEIEFVRFGGLRGKGMLAKLLLPLNLLRACIQSLFILHRINPDVVLGMGGYISFPTGVMAALTRRPLVIHEQNAIAGFANRALMRVARRVLSGFPKTLRSADWIGQPLRDELTTQPHPRERFAARQGPLKLLVIGGSLGAAALNERVPHALALLAPDERPAVIHQAGVKQLDALRENYRQAGITDDQLQCVPFIDDIANAYAQADVVICRAGAMTVAEIAAVGVAALFVPFPFAVDDHQTANAAFLAERGAATVIQQHALSAQRLADWIRQLTRAWLLDMASRAREFAKPDATEHVAQICASMVT